MTEGSTRVTLSPFFITLVNGVTDHIISTQKTKIKDLFLDIYLHVYHFIHMSLLL